MNILNAITESISGVLFNVALWLDKVVYSFINYLYKLFLILAQTRIISSDEISELIKRVYVLIGVVMLFVLAYGLLNAVVNPAAKDKNTSFKTVLGVIKAIVLIAIVPTAFDLAYAFQVAIVKQNTIGKIIIGNYTTVDSKGNTTDANGILNDAGINIAVSTLQAFIVPINGNAPSNAIIGDSGMSLQDVWDEAIENRSLSGIAILSQELKKDADAQAIEYSFIISTLAGAFLVWQLLKYCLSLGSRCIKLAFYELIAPAPILLSIIPSKKKLLNDWLHDVLTLFLEVFIRIMVLYIAIYLITVINSVKSSGSGIFAGLGFRYSAMAFAILIMGLISFIGTAPDIIGKSLGVDTSNLKKGFKDTLKEGGLYAAGGFVAGTVAGRSLFSGIRAAKSAHNTGGVGGVLGAANNEAAHRRAVKKAEAQGATRSMRIRDSIRNWAGAESLAEKAERKIESTDYVVKDASGKPITMDAKTMQNLDEKKAEAQLKLNAINESISHVQQNSIGNQKIMDYRALIKKEAESKVSDGKSKFSDEIVVNGKTYRGNFAAVEKAIQQDIDNGLITGDDITVAMQEKAAMLDRVRDRYINAVMSGSESNGLIKENVLNIRNSLSLIKNKDGVVLSETEQNRIAALMDSDAALMVNDSFKAASERNIEINAEAKQIENTEKTVQEDIIREIDYLTKQVEAQKTAAKTDKKYVGYQASKNIGQSANSGSGKNSSK